LLKSLLAVEVALVKLKIFVLGH